jgi:carbon-monoxide dehydrogenase large subunit
MMKSLMPSADEDLGIGASVRRVEDVRFIRGLGRYTDDLAPPEAAHLAIVRSPHAAARILGVDIARAMAMPGVIAVLTGRDLEEDGIGALQSSVNRNRRDGRPMPQPPFRPLALDFVAIAGDPVAIVVAETRGAAQDAAEYVDVTYEVGAAVTDAIAALKDGAPSVWPDESADNECFVFQQGDRAATDAAFARAKHVARLTFRISRVSANPMEPRAAIAAWDSTEDFYTLTTGTQGPHKTRSELAEKTLYVPTNRMRVISPDMGGAFGMRGSPTPEQALVLWAARRTGRTIRWTATRSESFVSDYHARDNDSTVELALDDRGMFLGLRVRTTANLGAYIGFNTAHSSTNNLGGLAGVYRTPHIHAEVIGVFTNTQPNAPYRGAGRPEATFALERVIDIAAAEMGIDRVDLRRRNLIAKTDMPFKTGLIFTYDSGDFARNLDLALDAGDWAGFPARREASRARGKLRGIGIANAIEIAAGPFRNPGEEAAELRFDPSGTATVLLGSHNHGQGHETVFRQLAYSFLGLKPDQVRIVAGDTDKVLHGKGTFGSRSIVAGGAALRRASDHVIEKGRRIAAHMLEAGEGDLDFADGRFTIAGTDRSVTLAEVAKASYVPGQLPPGLDYGLAAQSVVTVDEATFPNGCHICEVEIDEETGETEVVSYVVVDDVGTVINPLLVKGQIHGGVAQGLGQAMFERILYDADSGQMITGSFMDYAMPRASDMPDVHVISNPSPTPNNPLGAKGAGEAGTVGALAAIINAVVDGLSPFGVRHIDMPCTPDRVWAAMQAGRRESKVSA